MMWKKFLISGKVIIEAIQREHLRVFQNILKNKFITSFHYHPPKLSLSSIWHSVMSNSLRPNELQHARPPCPSPTPSLLKLMPIELVMPSSHLILCHPLLPLPPIPPSLRVFSNESTLHMRWPKYWSFSFSISPSNEHPGLISFRMDWLDLLAVQGTLKSLLQHHSSIWHYCRRNWKKSKYHNFSLSINIPHRSWHTLLTTLQSTLKVQNSTFCLYLKTGKKQTKNAVTFIAVYCVVCAVLSCSVRSDSLWPCQAPLPMGILQARMLEWVAMRSSRGSSQSRNRTQISRIAGRFFVVWDTREVKNTGLGRLPLLQVIFPTQELNQGLMYCRRTLYQLSYQGSLRPSIEDFLIPPPLFFNKGILGHSGRNAQRKITMQI